MLQKIINQRVEQLEKRLLTLNRNHDKHHEMCFPKDDSDGIYREYESKRSEYYNSNRVERELLTDNKMWDKLQEIDDNSPMLFEDSPESKYLGKSLDIIMEIKNEILAINYYNAIRGSKYTFRLIDDTINKVNKYNTIDFGGGKKVRTDNLNGGQ